MEISHKLVISHENYERKTQAENSNCGIKTFKRFTTLAPDIHTFNKDNIYNRKCRPKCH